MGELLKLDHFKGIKIYVLHFLPAKEYVWSSCRTVMILSLRQKRTALFKHGQHSISECFNIKHIEYPLNCGFISRSANFCWPCGPAINIWLASHRSIAAGGRGHNLLLATATTY